MRADYRTRTQHKEVTLTKRLALLGLLVAAFLVLAAPAMAFDGFRDDYTLTSTCATCHGEGNPFSNPDVVTPWSETAHAMIGTVELDPVTGELIGGTANAEPIADGPSCAGCHSANYKPVAHVPDANGVYPWENTAGDDAFSEPFVGCSTCHWSQTTGSPTAHNVPDGNMANADICGQCHSRYSGSVEQYENHDGTFSTRQYTLGDFNPLGAAPDWAPESITAYLNIATPESPQSMVYYTDGGGELLPFSARGHEEGAQQYSEWAGEGHAMALDGFIETMGGRFPFMTGCLECHSGDYILTEGTDDQPTIADAKYGVTCQVCHDPHTQSEQTSLWNEERNPQLTAPREELCVECHNAEIPVGQTATPGTEVHHPMKEIMEGRGAIDVPQGSVSVHKDKCVNCHMVPTSYDRNGVPMTGANHVFGIIEPETAAESLSTANIGGIKRPLPNSSCSECHGRSSDPYATYLTGTIENRQAQMQAWDAEVGAELEAAAVRLGHLERERALVPEGLHQPYLHRDRGQLGHPQLGLRPHRHPEGA
jgi:ribosomal protein L31